MYYFTVKSDIQPISVVVPTRNSKSYIIGQIQRLISNLDDAGLKILEILIVDDASSDETVSILKQFKNNEPKVRVVSHTAHRGLQLAVSTGIDLSRSDFVLICEDDFNYEVSDILSIVSPVLLGNRDACIATSNVGGAWLSSRLFWAFLRIISSGRVQNRELMFRCIGPEMLRQMRAHRDATRTITGLMLEIGLNVGRVDVFGISTGVRSSGHGVTARLHLFVDVYLTLARRPLFSLLYVSFVLIGGFLVTGVWGVSLFVVDRDSSALLPVLAFAVLFLLGSLITSLFWITNQTLLLIMREVRRRPLTSYQLVENATEERIEK